MFRFEADLKVFLHREPIDLVHVLTELPQRASDADVTDLLPFNFA